MDRPKIRKVFPENTEPGASKPFHLADPFGLLKDRFEVTERELQLIRLMNGERTPDEIASAFAEAHGEAADPSEVAELAARMGDALLLGDARFGAAYDGAQEAFRKEPLRRLRFGCWLFHGGHAREGA